jgi:putative membrane protein
MHSRLPSVVFSGACALAAFACKGSNSAPSQAPDGVRSSAAAAPASQQPAAVKPAAVKPAALNDGEIVAIAMAANNAEIEQGKLAREKASDARVRDFAAMMVDHHGDAQRDQQRLSVEPATSDDSQRLQDEARDALADLQTQSGRPFDEGYLQLQIDAHRKLLETLKTELLPAARSSSLKAYLEDIKPQMESHLAQAERLQQELGASQEGQRPASRRPDPEPAKQ